MVESPLCSYGQEQTIRHMVKECSPTKFLGGIEKIHTASVDAIKWMENLCVRL